MKRKILFSIFFLITGMFVIAQPVKKHGQLKVVGTKLVDAHDQPIALHGMSLGWHNLWPRFYNAGAVKTLVKDWHCSVVRAAMGVELNDSGYIKNPAGSVAKIKAVVDAAIKQGIYVIIDFHSHNIKLPEAKIFFEEMATTYGKYPNVIYELFNEPDYETWPEVKAYSEELIKMIRNIDPDNIILVGCPKWDQDIQLPAADPIKGYSNLMYTMHFYAGTHKQWLRDRCDEAITKGLPLFISECAGMEASGDGPIDYAEWNKFVSWMNDKGLSWVAWSVSDKKETCSILNPSAAATGKWKKNDLKEWGTLTKAALKKY
ncbi:glycoside hydrolase family 5 protein [Ferruginibacter sp. SUN106]|uniref:glycoside hydrolase family 5 protein n=1 Tax=Ferruginibacter sp. SUN106 TaxID=2978348 RepID=UPI003D361F7C